MQQKEVKRGSSRLDIDGNVRLERKGTFIAWIIEVKVNQKKKRNTTQDVLMSIITKINIGMLCMQELAFWMCRLRCDTLSKWFSILWNKTTTKKHHLIESKKKNPFNLCELDSDTDIMCSFCQCCLDNMEPVILFNSFSSFLRVVNVAFKDVGSF